MHEIVAALAFALLIAAQFLAAIMVTSRRETLYANPNEPPREALRPMAECPKTSMALHATTPAITLARLELARRATN
jgi:hypothetical protein